MPDDFDPIVAHAVAGRGAVSMTTNRQPRWRIDGEPFRLIRMEPSSRAVADCPRSDCARYVQLWEHESVYTDFALR